MKPTNLKKFNAEPLLKPVKHVNARQFVDALEGKAWISCNDPTMRILRAVDENLQEVLEISLKDFKETKDFLTGKEVDAFGKEDYEELSGERFSEHERFLLSTHYLQNMANYIGLQLRAVLDEHSLLRKNSKVDILQAGAPVYDFNPERGAYFFDESSDDFLKVTGEPRHVNLVLFEVSVILSKRYSTIWEMKIDDFLPSNTILDKENEIYEKAQKKLSEEVLAEETTIVTAIKTDLTCLPTSDWLNKEAGFVVFEQIGVGIFK